MLRRSDIFLECFGRKRGIIYCLIYFRYSFGYKKEFKIEWFFINCIIDF